MVWPQIPELQCACAGVARRNRSSLVGPWDAKTAPTSCLLEAFQIGMIQPFFFCLRSNNDGITVGGSLREKNTKKQVTLAFQSRTRCPLGTITHHSLFPPRSFRLVHASPHSHGGVLFLTGSSQSCRLLLLPLL